MSLISAILVDLAFDKVGYMTARLAGQSLQRLFRYPLFQLVRQIDFSRNAPRLFALGARQVPSKVYDQMAFVNVTIRPEIIRASGLQCILPAPMTLCLLNRQRSCRIRLPKRMDS